jgi:AcrR family transcriptional regulator
MKDTFYHLSEERQQRLIDACIEEFGEFGYDKSTTDRIIQRVGISKGGLYEYIESKEDLFLFVLEICFERLYNNIRQNLPKNANDVYSDLIARTRLVSSVAVDYYVENPDMVRVIARALTITQPRLFEKAELVFNRHFNSVFQEIDESQLRFSRVKLLDLLRWLIIKTRDDFISSLKDSSNISSARKAYLDTWEFYLDVLKSGIYRQ